MLGPNLSSIFSRVITRGATIGRDELDGLKLRAGSRLTGRRKPRENGPPACVQANAETTKMATKARRMIMIACAGIGGGRRIGGGRGGNAHQDRERHHAKVLHTNAAKAVKKACEGKGSRPHRVH